MRLYTDIQTDDLPNAGVLFPARSDALSTLLALCIGVVMTLCVNGYQFGKSNHTIYLLDALHHAHPELLAKDWFVTGTFQYHAAFGWMTRGLMSIGLLPQGFLLGYLALVVAFHLAWFKLVNAVGGNRRTYLVSVLFYYLSAGGTGLGIYQFFQDSSFLASNIANVALLWAFYLWVKERKVWSGICFGLAGLFHLNHALVGVGAWIALNGLDWIFPRLRKGGHIESLVIRLDPQESRRLRRADIRAWIAAIVPCTINIAMGVALQLHRGGKLPLAEFVSIYVKFRHPHHYDPRAWPAALWICFIWAIPLAAMAYFILQGRADAPAAIRARRQAMRIFLLMLGLQCVSLLFAGKFYINESLIQMSLYRFSIYCQLFACIGAALLFCDCTRLAGTSVRTLLIALCALIAATPLLMWFGPKIGFINIEGVRAFINSKQKALALFFILSCAPGVAELIAGIRQKRVRDICNASAITIYIALIVVGWNQWIGLTLLFEKNDADYLSICDYARENTPIDAIFLVPPSESEFRYRAQRAIVVNFKAVPQLGGELSEWVKRLKATLGVTDLNKQLPHGFDKIGPAMAAIYNKRPTEDLLAVAHDYDARYLVATHHLEPQYESKLIKSAGDRYFLYDLQK